MEGVFGTARKQKPASPTNDEGCREEFTPMQEILCFSMVDQAISERGMRFSRDVVTFKKIDSETVDERRCEV
jgi:hypothetical protein